MAMNFSARPRDASGRFVKVQFTGVGEMERKLRNVLKGFLPEVSKALFEEAQIEMAEAKRRTPVDTGDLRGSGFVSKPEYNGRTVSVGMNFGGPAAPYAIYVHEDLEAFHRVGQAKFLSSVMDESAPYMAQRVAARIKLASLI